MNSFFLNRALAHLAANPPDAAGANALYDQYKSYLKGVTPDQLEALKPHYPMLVPAIDAIKVRITEEGQTPLDTHSDNK